MYVKSYKDLIVWRKAIALVEEIYRLTQKFPPPEMYGLTSQMRRAAISIPSNIAEGYGRKSRKEYYQFLSISFGSALELETQLLIAKNLKYGKEEEYLNIHLALEEIIRMLYVMKEKLELD